MNRYTAGAFALSVTGAVALISANALASDHREAPGTRANTIADIGDYYAWHDGGNLNMVLTFATLAEPGVAGTFDGNTLYTLRFDTTGDNVSDVDVTARFGQDTSGAYGVQVTGISETPIVGPVETIITEGDVSLFAGSMDDPFFFDLEGFNETVATGTLSLDPTRDFFAGTNVTAIVLQVPLSSVVGDVTTFDTWAISGSL